MPSLRSRTETSRPVSFAHDMELRQQRALVTATERQLRAAEVAIADHHAATLRQRKRRVLLRAELRKQLKRLNRLESKQ